MPKTIDDIIPPSRRRAMNADSQKSAEIEPPANFTPPSNTTPLQPLTPMSPASPMPPSRVKIRVGRSFPYGTALIVLVIVAVCAGALYAFAGAEVKITPTSQTGSVSGDFTATNGTGDLPYTVVTVSKTLSVAVPAESTITATTSAQGTIIISNAQSKPQNLINNTRFTTPEGLVFRIHSPVTIPPETSSGPGTVSATVFADQAGTNYNVGPTTFTLPGLQGSSLFTLVTAKSTGSMTGGFSGTRPAVSSATDSSNESTLQTSLESSMQTSLDAQIPTGDVVVPGASQTTYQPLPDSATTSPNSSTQEVAITEQGTITAVAFPSDALAKAIAYKIAGTYSGEPVSLASVNTMSLIPDATSTDITAASSASTYSFNLSGNATIVWQVNAQKIAGAVAGKTRDSAQSILAGFPEVNKADLILRPFWSDTFPQDPTHIHVTVVTPSPTNP